MHQGPDQPARTGPPGTRVTVAVLALLGAAVAAYLTLVQVDLLGHAWDPFFGDGSDQVLDSQVSRALPVPDASLGLAAYLAEAALALTGAPWRWRRRPWLPLAYDLVALGLGIAAVTLVALQAGVVGSWCTLCLCSATLSLVILGLGRLQSAPPALRRIRRRRRDGAGWARAVLGPG